MANRLYKRRRDLRASPQTGRATPTALPARSGPRGVDSLERDAEVEGQVGLHVVVRLVAAGGGEGLIRHVGQALAGRSDVGGYGAGAGQPDSGAWSGDEGRVGRG